MSPDSAGRAWCWSEDDGDVIIPEQPAIACYTNPAGAIVLRQHGAWNDDDDAWIFVNPDHALAIATAIIEAAGLDATALVPEPAPCAIKPVASTSAERQKRYRQRKKKEPALFDGDDRNVTPVTPVTPRDESAA